MGRIIESYREAYRGLSREVWILSVVGLVNRAGTMVLPFLTLYLCEELGYTPTEAGKVLAVYGVGSIAGTALGGRLVERVGPRAVMVSSLVLTGFVLFLLGAAESRPAILATVSLFALVAELFRPACNTAISECVPGHERVRAFGLYRLAINAGFTLGPAIGGVLAGIDYALLFWVDGVTCLCAGFILLGSFSDPRTARASEHAEEGAASANSPWRDRLFVAVFVLVFLQALMFFQVMSTLSLYLKEQRGQSEAAIGLLFAVNTAVIVAFEMLLVRRIQGRSPLRVTALSCIFLGIGFGILPWTYGFAALAGTILIWTMGEMLSAPMIMAWFANRAVDGNRGRYMGAVGICFASSSVAAPLIGTWMYQSLGPDTPWLACLVLGPVLFVALELAARSERAGH